MIEHDDQSDPLELPGPIAELSSHFPKRSDAEWDALVAGIVNSAAPELARRRGERGVVRSLLRWARPVGVAAAAVLLCGAIGLAVTSEGEAIAATPATPSFAEIVDREPASTLLASDLPPSAGDLASALERDSFQQVQP
jgi:hypothetical protein